MLKVKRAREWSPETSAEPCSPHRFFSDSVPPKRMRSVFDIKEEEFTQRRAFQNESHFANVSIQDTEIPMERPTSKKRSRTDGLFTYEEVQELIKLAVEQKEMQLRAEYDRILQDRLQEQYMNFAKFNEDYISRQLKERDFSYLS